MSKLTVVIPAYNESQGIEQVIRRIAAVRDDLRRQAGIAELEVLVVDDGSTDDTAAAVLRVTGAVRGSRVGVRMIRHGTNRGYGAALQSGFDKARGSYLAFLDADCTYPPEQLPDLCYALRHTGAAVALGDRMRSPSSQMSFVRWVGNALLALLATLLGGQRVHDCCSGMRVLSAATWRTLGPLPDGLDFTPAMTMRALHRQIRLHEHIIPYHARVGRSKLNVVRDGLRFVATIFRETHAWRPARLYALAASLAVAVAGLGVLALLAARRWPTPPDGLSVALGIAILAGALLLTSWSVVLRERTGAAPQSGNATRREEEQVT